MSSIPKEPAQASPTVDPWAALQQFETEYNTRSHRRIAAAWNPELFDRYPPAQPYRADAVIANQCVQTVSRLAAEHRLRHWRAVVGIYESWREHFDQCSDYQESFKVFVQDALKHIALEYKLPLVRALEQNDDLELEQIVSDAAAVIDIVPILDYFEREQVLTSTEHNRAALALERLAIIRKIQDQLTHKDTQDRALALFDAQVTELRLTDSQALTAEDRLALYDVRRTETRHALREAVAGNEDDQILSAASAAHAAGWNFRDTTLDIVRQASEREAARGRLDRAHNERERMIAYDDEILSHDRKVSPEKRQELQSDQRLYKPLLALRRAIQKSDFRTIAALIGNPALAQELAPRLNESERQVVLQVQSALQTLGDLRQAFAAQPRTVETLNRIIELSSSPEMTRTCQALMTPTEKEQVRKALITSALIDELKSLDRAEATPSLQLAIARTYQKAQAEGIILPSSLNWSKIRAALEFQERWSALTRALDARDEYAIFKAWNPAQMDAAVDLLSPREKRILLQTLQNISNVTDSTAQPLNMT